MKIKDSELKYFLAKLNFLQDEVNKTTLWFKEN